MNNTPNYNLPIYENGDNAAFLTAGGFNEAMEKVDAALTTLAGTGLDKPHQSWTLVGFSTPNEAAVTVTIPATISLPEGKTPTNMNVFVNGGNIISSVTFDGDTKTFTVTFAEAPAEAVSFNLSFDIAIG